MSSYIIRNPYAAGRPMEGPDGKVLRFGTRERAEAVNQTHRDREGKVYGVVSPDEAKGEGEA